MRPWDAQLDIGEELSHIINEHVEWYDGMLAAVYSGSKTEIELRLRPERSLIDFFDKNKDKAFWSAKAEEGLRNHYLKMLEEADRLGVCLGDGRDVNDDLVKSFRSSFLNLSFLINKVRDHTSLIAFGYDPYTGIRNRKSALIDIKKECERKLRMDIPFAILLMSIENLSDVEDIFGRAKTDVFLRKVIEIIEQKLRMFDDMYRMSENEFLISVKLTDKPGAMLFAQRIQRFFDDHSNAVKMDGYEIQVRLSFVISEPVPGEDILLLLDYMRDDLNDRSVDSGTIITYREVAPIEKFVERGD